MYAILSMKSLICHGEERLIFLRTSIETEDNVLHLVDDGIKIAGN